MSQKGMTGGWTKHGGPRDSAIKKRHRGPWRCQSCKREMPEQLTPYLFEWMEGDWIRVCAVCFNEECKVLYSRRNEIDRLA